MTLPVQPPAVPGTGQEWRQPAGVALGAGMLGWWSKHMGHTRAAAAREMQEPRPSSAWAWRKC